MNLAVTAVVVMGLLWLVGGLNKGPSHAHCSDSSAFEFLSLGFRRGIFPASSDKGVKSNRDIYIHDVTCFKLFRRIFI